ncbi:MAG: protein kinase, partial [Candidatus Sumerlaeia bacterium]|nr:protein kinase [Candidatus Sumerlaeia bacterium]
MVGSALDDGFLYAYDTGIRMSQDLWPTRTPWMTSGGSPYISQTMNREWAELENNRRRELRSIVAGWESELDSAIEQGEWDRATELVNKLVDFDPLEKRYSSLRLSVAFKRHFFTIISITLLTLALVGFITWKVIQYLTYRRLHQRAEGANARGDHDEARRLYVLLHGKLPKDSRVATALARVLISQREFSAEYSNVLSQAWQANQGDRDILHAYTRSLLAAGPNDGEEALNVYNQALASEFPEPQLVEYGIGRCMIAKGDYEEAGKRLRSALRGGLTTNELYSALCDVYMNTGNTSAKALPVFQQQHAHRREDPEFLKAFLASCMDAKKADNEVESLCHEVLEFDSSHIPAYLQLAMIGMQKNQIGPAIDEIQNALAVDENNAQAVSLLAYCFLMQGRKDEEALHAYKRALVDSPREKEILKTVSAIYFERGVYNEESIAIYNRCLEENPGDVPTLRALAQTARLTSDHNLAVRAIEALQESGHVDKSLTLQLANAYVKLNITEPRVEKTLRSALQVEPENPEFIALYTRALIAQDRTDIDSIKVFEKHLSNEPNDLGTGRQLAKSFISANRYEHALTTTKRFLAIAPDDEELQRLNALASLYDNKIDEAVSEYKRILERNPGDKEALVNLALAYGQKMRTDEEAQKLFGRALSLAPENDLLHLAMARVQVANNNAAAAVEAYKEALKVREDNEQNVLAHITALLADAPETLRVRWFQVELLVSYGHFREALDQLDYINQNHPGQGTNILRVLDVILQKDENNTRALLMAGRLQLAEDRIPLAIKHIEKAYQLQPAAQEGVEAAIRVYTAALEKKEDPETRLRLGKVYYNEQEYDDAIGCFQKTAQDYRFEAESTKMLGKCFTGKGMLDIALQEYRKLVVDEETKELLYELAQRYESKKDLVGAKTVYRQLFAADINYKDVKTRFEMLSGSTSDPMSFEKTNIVQQMSEAAARRYELLDELGRGAMGIVYRARDKELEEIVALKILPDNMSNNPEAVRRFKIEARNARKLSHPNIVRIHDIGEEMGRKYISMEYVDGSDLKKKFKSAPEGKLPLGEVLKYMMDIADALGYAHRLGIVHRDIKPANIMLTSAEEVKVTDFGIAKLMDSAGGGGMGAAEGTMIGAVIGTPLYMSPEQVQGIPVDNRADLYSFGIMFYEMLSGRPPFTQGDLAYQHLHKDPEPLQGLPGGLWEVVSKCLAKEKEERWENAELIYDAIRDIYKKL